MEIKRVTPALLLGALLVAGCGGSSDSSKETDQSQLDKNERLWEASSVDGYQYTIHTSCFCFPEEDVVVLVVDGEVASAFYTPSGVFLSGDRLAATRNIEGLFDLIQNIIIDDIDDDLEVEYDETFGYPSRININISQQASDGGVTYTIFDFQ